MSVDHLDYETVLVGVMILVLGVAAVLAVTRIIRGPAAMDRAVANEVLVSTIVCTVGLEAAITRDSTTLPILISISLIGFVSSVAVARFVSHDYDGISRDSHDVTEAHEIPGVETDPSTVPVKGARR